MTTSTKLEVALVSVVVVGCVLLSVAVYFQSVALAVLFSAVIVYVGNTMVRCPRCGTNALQMDTPRGRVYSVLNTKCRTCGLSFTQGYRDARGYVIDSDRGVPVRKAAGSEVADAARRSQVRTVGHVALVRLVSGALIVGYVNMSTILDAARTTSDSIVIGVITSSVYALWVTVVSLVVRRYEGAARRPL